MGQRQCATRCRPRDQTSRPELPATDRRRGRRDCSGNFPVGLLDHLMNVNTTPGPRMPWIKKVAFLGPVGVLSSCCTTPRGHTPKSPGRHGRVRHNPQSATVARAAPCQRLRASARRFTRPAGHNPRRKRTHNWIETGGKVTRFGASDKPGAVQTMSPSWICLEAKSAVLDPVRKRFIE